MNKKYSNCYSLDFGDACIFHTWRPTNHWALRAFFTKGVILCPRSFLNLLRLTPILTIQRAYLNCCCTEVDSKSARDFPTASCSTLVKILCCNIISLLLLFISILGFPKAPTESRTLNNNLVYIILANNCILLVMFTFSRYALELHTGTMFLIVLQGIY